MSGAESRQQPYLSLADVKLVTNRSSKPGKLVVKHTFLEVDASSASPPGSPQARVRACSDGALESLQNNSLLKDLQSSDLKSPPVTTTFNASEEEIVLCGLSDSEDAASVAEDQESTTTAATRSVIASRSVNSSDVSSSFQSEEMLAQSAPCRSAVAVQQEGARKEMKSAGRFQDLSNENQRLAKENAVLRQKCLEVAQAAQQAAAATASAALTRNVQPSGFADAHIGGMAPSPMPEAGGYPSMPAQPVPAAGASPQQFAWFCQMPGFDMPILAIPATAVMMQASSVQPAHCQSQTRQEQCIPQSPQLRVPDAPHSKAAGKQSMRPAGPGHQGKCMKGAEGRDEAAFHGEETSYPTGASQDFTTVMLRNVPNNYNRTMLLKLMGSEGFDGQYDFIYLPIDFKSRASLGYAFVNLTSHEAALRFMAVFRGYSNWVLPSKKVCSVDWSGPHQGLEAHVERYRNSPVMHEVVPDMYKPVLFKDGVRVPFPPATKKLREPRIRNY